MLTLTRRSYIVLGSLLFVLLAVGGVSYYTFVSPTGIKAREEADLSRIRENPQASFINLSGEKVAFGEFDSEILIVNVWASWSPYTPSDHDVLKGIKDAYGDSVSIVALNRKETKETAEAYLETIGKRDGIEYVIDENDNLFVSLGGYAMPETFVFDSVGNTVIHIRGVLHASEIEAVIAPFLE
jgi:thiol-disulfide isomerase/thioredoxin